ncbi:MAG: hypothetical protein E7658_04985 [Ruminococcaceae bacterium]|nr:hypothetical protein [Oscillospiraceae bacterium]
MENENSKITPRLPDITVDTHFDFKLYGWPASAVLITFCLSGVLIYGIKKWSEINMVNAHYLPSASDGNSVQQE